MQMRPHIKALQRIFTKYKSRLQLRQIVINQTFLISLYNLIVCYEGLEEERIPQAFNIRSSIMYYSKPNRMSLFYVTEIMLP